MVIKAFPSLQGVWGEGLAIHSPPAPFFKVENKLAHTNSTLYARIGPQWLSEPRRLTLLRGKIFELSLCQKKKASQAKIQTNNYCELKVFDLTKALNYTYGFVILFQTTQKMCARASVCLCVCMCVCVGVVVVVKCAYTSLSLSLSLSLSHTHTHTHTQTHTRLNKA